LRAIKKIIDRHTEDAAFLWLQRNDAVKEPHYDLNDLAELDNRLAAHLDGLQVAGTSAWPSIEQNLKIGEPGELFVAAWYTLIFRDEQKFNDIVETVMQSEDRDSLIQSLISALAWCPVTISRPWLIEFSKSSNSFQQYLAVAAYGLIRADLDIELDKKIHSTHPIVSVRALRAVGELGRRDLADKLLPFHQDEDRSKRFWSLWSSVLLGSKSAVDNLQSFVIKNDELSERALNLYCRAKPNSEAAKLIKQLASSENNRRLAIVGSGYNGDPYWIPGLFKLMLDPSTARIAGEAFSMITGADLKYLDLDQDAPKDFESGPNDDPADGNVALDIDDSLPWPNATLIAQWWEENNSKYLPGKRYLCGNAINETTCMSLLKNGYQRQRIAASYELALSGKPLFNVRQSGLQQKSILMR